MKTSTLCAIINACLIPAIACIFLTGCKKSDDSGPVVNNNLFSNVTVAATGGTYIYPKSAVPDAANQFIYFIATDSATGGTGVFKVAAAGGSAAKVFTGAPFSKPMDIAMSTDNATLYVADSVAGILSISVSGGTPVIVAGTAGTMPVAIEVIQRASADEIYFCGTNIGDGQKAIFEIASGGAVSANVRYKGAPLMSPAGIVSKKDGTLFVADASGIVHKLSTTGAITQVAGNIIMGSPAGIALTPDDQTLAVSSRSPSSGTSQVQIIDLATGGLSVFNKVINSSTDPGGLHPARSAGGATGRYAWADVTRPGRIYRLDP